MSVTEGAAVDLAELCNVLAEQERLLVFQSFGADLAWEVGTRLRAEAMRLHAAMTFEVQVAGRVLFACSTDGAGQASATGSGQADWIRRKRNTVMRFGKSSYRVGRELALAGETLEGRHGLGLGEYAAHGGGFPIVLAGTGLVGSVVASGLPQAEDHALVVSTLSELLKGEPPALP